MDPERDRPRAQLGRSAKNGLFTLTGRPRVPNKMTSTTTTTTTTMAAASLLSTSVPFSAVIFKDPDHLCERCDKCDDGRPKGYCACEICDECDEDEDDCECSDDSEDEDAQERERQHANDYDDHEDHTDDCTCNACEDDYTNAGEKAMK